MRRTLSRQAALALLLLSTLIIGTEGDKLPQPHHTLFFENSVLFWPNVGCSACLPCREALTVALAGANFSKATIYQSSPFPGTLNNITLHLKLDVKISDRTKILVTGFKGHKVPENLQDPVELDGDSSALFQDAGGECSSSGSAGRAKWENATTLVMWPSQDIPANTDLRVSFEVRNGDLPQDHQTILIHTRGSIVIEDRYMWTNIALAGFDPVDAETAQCAPKLDSSEGAPTIFGVGEDSLDVTTVTSDGIAVDSTFSPVSVGCSSGVCPEAQKCKGGKLRADGVLEVEIEHSGCGCPVSVTQEPVYLVANAAAPGQVGDGRFNATVEWMFVCSSSGSAPAQTMASCLDACASTCTGSVQSVTILNPGWGYSALPSLSLYPTPATGGTCDPRFKAVVSSGSGFSAEFTHSNGVTTITSLSTGSGYTSSDKIVLDTAASIGICGFAGGNVFMDRPSLDARSVNTTQTTISVSDPFGNSELNNIFTEPPRLAITGWSRLTAGCNASVLRPRMEAGKFLASDSAELWSVPGDSAPLKIRAPGILYARIRQSSEVPGGDNTLSVSLVATSTLNGEIIRIRGLDPAVVSNGEIAIAGETDDSTIVNGSTSVTATGKWSCPGTVTINVTETILPIPAGTVVSFSFTVSNNIADVPQEIGVPTIELLSANAQPLAMQVGDADILDTSSVAFKKSLPLFQFGPPRFSRAIVWQDLALPFFDADEVVTNIADGTETGSNTLTFVLNFTALVPRTSFIEISGLSGVAATADSLSLTGPSAGILASKFCSRPEVGLNDPCDASALSKGLWTASTKTLRLHLVEDVSEGLEFSITSPLVPVDNPTISILVDSEKQSTNPHNSMFPGVSIPATSMEMRKPVENSNMATTCPVGIYNQEPRETKPFVFRSPRFLVKKIKQNSPFLGDANNYLTISFSTNVPLPIGSIVTFSGLTGANFTGGTSFHGSAPSGWTLLAKTSSLELTKSMSPAAAGAVITFAVVTENPGSYQPAMNTRVASSVKASVSGSVVIAASSMVLDSPQSSSLSTETCYGDEALNPLRILPAAFCIATVQQESSFAGEPNGLNISLATTFPVTTATNITISGFPKDLAPLGFSLDTASHTMDYKAASGIVVIVPGEAIAAGVVADFEFSFKNWNSSELKVQENGNALSSPQGRTAKQLIVKAGPVTIGVGLVAPSFSGSDCDLDQRPFSVYEPGICSCDLTHNSSLPGEPNLVTLTVSFNVDLPTNLLTRTRNFTIYQRGQTPSNNFLTVSGIDSAAFEFHEYFSSGTNAGTTKISLRDGVTTNAGSSITIHLPLRNLESADSRSLVLDTVTCSGLITTQQPELRTAAVGQNNPYPSQINTLTVTLESNYAPSSIAFKIEGLSKSGFTTTETTLDVSVGMPVCGAFGSSQAALMHPDTGTFGQGVMKEGAVATDAVLWFKVDGASWRPETSYVFSFNVTNPARGPYDKPKTLYVTGYDKWDTGQKIVYPRRELVATPNTTCISEQVYMPVEQESLPLYIRRPMLIASHSEIGQTNPFPAVSDNMLNITLALNTDVDETTQITLTRLKGLVLSKTSDLKLDAHTAGGLDVAITKSDTDHGLAILLNVGDSITTSRTGPAIIRFALVDVLNPEAAQPAAEVSVEISGPITVSEVKIPTPATASRRDAFLVQDAKPAEILEAGPLYIRGAAFRIAEISQTVPYPAAQNILNVRLAFTVPVSAASNTKITISNLKALEPGEDFKFVMTEVSPDEWKTVIQCGLNTTSSNTDTDMFKHPEFNPPVTGQFLGNTVSCGDSGNCQELVARMHLVNAMKPVDEVTFALNIINPVGAQASPGAKIAASGIAIGATEMTHPSRAETCGTSANSCSDPRDTEALFIRAAGIDYERTVIGQTSPFAGSSNMLRITLVANGLIPKDTVITIAGLVTSPSFSPRWADFTFEDSLHVISQASGGSAGSDCTVGEFSTAWGNATGSFTVQCGELSRLIIENAGIGYNSTGAALTFPTCGTQPTGYSGRSGQAYFEQPSTSDSNVAEQKLLLKYDMIPCVPLVLSVPLTNPVTSLGGAAAGSITIGFTGSDEQAVKLDSGDNTPFRVTETSFVMAKLAHSTPWPGQFNEISITMKTNADIPGGNYVHVVMALEVKSGQLLAPSFAPGLLSACKATSTCPSASIDVETTDFVGTMTLSKPISGLVYGDYLMLEPQMEIVKVLAVQNATVRIIANASSGDVDPLLNANESTSVYRVIPIDDKAGNATGLFGKWMDMRGTTLGGASAAELRLKIQPGETLVANTDYVFSWMVQNPVPTTSSHWLDRGVVFASSAGSNESRTTASVDLTWNETLPVETMSGTGYSFKGGDDSYNETYAQIDLAHSLTSTDTVLVVNALSSNAISSFFFESGHCIVDEEIMRIISIEGANMTVRRGVSSTTPVAHFAGASLRALLGGLPQRAYQRPRYTQPISPLLMDVRQTTALPGTLNRIVLRMMFNYRFAALDNLTISIPGGHALTTSSFSGTCDGSTAEVLSKCSSVSPSAASEFFDVAYVQSGALLNVTLSAKSRSVLVAKYLANESSFPGLISGDQCGASTTSGFQQGDVLEFQGLSPERVRVTESCNLLRGVMITDPQDHNANTRLVSIDESEESWGVAPISSHLNTIPAGKLLLLTVDFFNDWSDSAPEGSFKLSGNVAGQNFSESHSLTSVGSGLTMPGARVGQGFYIRQIGQSTSGPWAEENTISVTLVSGTAIPGGGATKILLSGFLNASVASTTADPDNAPRMKPCTTSCSVALSGKSASNFSDIGGTTSVATWDPMTETFSMVVQNKLQAGEQYEFSFIIMNPPRPQTSPEIFIETTNASSFSMSVGDIVASCDCASATGQLGIGGGFNSTWSANFEFTNATNLTSIVVTRDHQPGSGFPNLMHVPYSTAFTPESCVCSSTGVGDGDSSAGCACWSPILAVVSSTCNCSVSGTFQLEPGYVAFPRSKMVSQQVLHIVQTNFEMSNISQKVPWPGVANVLRVTLISNSALSKGTEITFGGLRDTTSGPTKDIKTISGGAIFQNARYTKNGDTFTMTTVEYLKEGSVAVFEFWVTNPAVAAPQNRPPAVVTVLATNVAGMQGSFMDASPINGVPGVYGGIDGAAQPLAIFTDTYPQCLKGDSPLGDTIMRACPTSSQENCTAGGIVPVFSTSIMSQSTCELGELNTLTVTLISNLNLATECYAPCFSSASLTMTGLKGLADDFFTGDSQDVTITDVDGSGAAGPDGIFGSIIVLKRGGSAVFELQDHRVLFARKEYKFSFQVRNGLEAQATPIVAFDVFFVGRHGGYGTSTPLDAIVGPGCYRVGGKCKNVRFSTNMRLAAATKSSSPMVLGARGTLQDTSISFKSNFGGGAIPDGPVVANFSMLLGPNIFIRKFGANRTFRFNIGAFGGNPVVRSSGPADMFTASSAILSDGWLTLTTATNQTYLNGTGIWAVIEGITMRSTGVYPASIINVESFANDCRDGFVPASPVKTLNTAPSIRPTSIDVLTNSKRVAGALCDLTLRFALNGGMASGETIVFTLPDFSGISAQGEVSGWRWKWDTVGSVPKLTLTAVSNKVASSSLTNVVIPSSAGIRAPAQGLPPVLSASKKILVTTNAAVGPVPAEAVGSYPVFYKWGCYSSKVVISGTVGGFCDSTYKVKACATSVAAITAFAESRGYNGVAPFDKGAPLATCMSRHNDVCTAINSGYKAAASNAWLSDVEKKKLCCENSPDTGNLAIGNLAGCGNETGTTPDDIQCVSMDGSAGVSTVVSGGAVALRAGFNSPTKICCDYCESYYGVTGCSLGNGGAPGKAAVRSVCASICTNAEPCFGRSSGGSAVAVPAVFEGTLFIGTEGGDGVRSYPTDTYLCQARGRELRTWSL